MLESAPRNNQNLLKDTTTNFLNWPVMGWPVDYK